MSNPLKRDFDILRILFLLLLFGQALALSVALFFVKPSPQLQWMDFVKNPAALLAPLSVLLALILAQVVQFFQNKKKPKLLTLPAKMHHYRDTVILKAIFFEISSLYCTALMVFTQSFKPFLFFALAVLVFLSLWPTVRGLKKGYGLE